MKNATDFVLSEATEQKYFNSVMIAYLIVAVCAMFSTQACFEEVQNGVRVTLLQSRWYGLTKVQNGMLVYIESAFLC